MPKELGQEQLLKKVAGLLEHRKIPYMLTGAYSVIYYGRPRASHDIDFVVEVGESDVQKIVDLFKEISFDFMLDLEMIMEAVRRKGQFNIIYFPIMAKLDFWLLKNEEFDQQRFKRREKHRILGQNITLSSAEDTILQKLRWYGDSKIEKHLVDAAFVLQLQKKLDRKYLLKWIKKLGIQAYFKLAQKVDLELYY